MVIINVRGTSGSGKSTLVRKVTAEYAARTIFKEPDRERPIGYIYSRPEGRNLAVIGHYETDCGGCDTITNMDRIFELVRESAEANLDVLFEGLLISADANRCTALWQWAQERGIPMLVLALDTPLDLCLASVNGRREAAYQRRLERIEAENTVKAANGHKLLPLPTPKGDVNPKNTESKFKGVLTTMKRLAAAGVPTATLSRDGALERISKELGL